MIWQTYISNNERIVHLKPRPSINNKSKSDLSPESKSKEPSIRPKTGGKCEECGKHLQDERNRFCSITCKVTTLFWYSVKILLFTRISFVDPTVMCNFLFRSQCFQWRLKTKVVEACSLQNLKALTSQWMIIIIQNLSHLSLKLSHMGGLKWWISESVQGKVRLRGQSSFSLHRRYHYSCGFLHFFSYLFLIFHFWRIIFLEHLREAQPRCAPYWD